MYDITSCLAACLPSRGVSVPGPMFLPGVSVGGVVSVQGGVCARG